MSNIHKQIFNTKMKYLVESKTDYILQNEKAVKSIAHRYLQDINLSIEKMTEDQIRQAAETALKECEKLPYTNKYMIWLMKQYIQGKFIIPEDLSKLNSELERFSKISHKLEKKDINNYSWEEFLDIVPELEEIHTSNEEERIAKSGAEKLFEDDKWIVIHPKTEEAACYYGSGTRWCTASTKGYNYFDSYNAEGNLYIVISKQNPSIKYQIHFESNSFMDVKDIPPTLEELDSSGFLEDNQLLDFLAGMNTNENTLPNELKDYNGKEFSFDLYDIKSLFYEDQRGDYLSVDFIDDIINGDIPSYWSYELNSYENVQYTLKYNKQNIVSKILSVFTNKSLSIKDATEEKRYMEEIIDSYLDSESVIETLNDLIDKVKERTNADQVADDIYITSTYNEAHDYILSELSNQLKMELYVQDDKLYAKPDNIEKFKKAIKLFEIAGEINKDEYATDLDTDIARIISIYIDNESISIMEPNYGWNSFDYKEFKRFIENSFCPELESLVTEKDIKNIEEEFKDYYYD